MKTLLLGLLALIALSAHAWDADKFQKPSDAELKKKLTPLQYSVTQEADTERPFNNLYWNNHEEGIYVDVVSGEPLFSSKDKFDSGTGWPSFTKPLVERNITTQSDTTLASERTEVRSVHADSHLGHVFNDGPQPTGLRFCMNSAALRFIPKERLEAEGYGEFASQFNLTSGKRHLVVAGGSFWTMQKVFTHAPGVLEVVAGYTGGSKPNPTYADVIGGTSGYREAVEIFYDPKKTAIEKLLETYWLHIDPFDGKGQFCDHGAPYTSAIYYAGADEQKAVENAKAFVKKAKIKGTMATEILPLGKFYDAEGYHQNYAQKNPEAYRHYRKSCGNDTRGRQIWGARYPKES